MEYLDLYDENMNLTGKTILRGSEKPEKGNYVRIVIVFIQNNEGKFLIQKTSKEKGSVWATTGGFVKSGSNCDKTVVEEIEEELGLSLDIKDLKHILTQKREYAFQDTYYIKRDINIEDLILQKEEVEYVSWLSVEEINKLIEQDEFRKGNIEAFKYLIEKGDL